MQIFLYYTYNYLKKLSLAEILLHNTKNPRILINYYVDNLFNLYNQIEMREY